MFTKARCDVLLHRPNAPSGNPHRLCHPNLAVFFSEPQLNEPLERQREGRDIDFAFIEATLPVEILLDFERKGGRPGRLTMQHAFTLERRCAHRDIDGLPCSFAPVVHQRISGDHSQKSDIGTNSIIRRSGIGGERVDKDIMDYFCTRVPLRDAGDLSAGPFFKKTVPDDLLHLAEVVRVHPPERLGIALAKRVEQWAIF